MRAVAGAAKAQRIVRTATLMFILPLMFAAASAAETPRPTGSTSLPGTLTPSVGAGRVTRDVTFAPHLPTASKFTGKSIRDTRLSAAAYSLSKVIGVPKTVDVACWSVHDWSSVGGKEGGVYQTLAFWSPQMPHWVQLSPTVCRAVQTLLSNRPMYPNVFTANAVETLTHEMMHAIGIRSEPEAECFGMQLSYVLARKLDVPAGYSLGLARLNLSNYRMRPPSYRDTSRCRENGAWDLFPNEDSPPWHVEF